MHADSQLVCLLPIGIFNRVVFIYIICSIAGFQCPLISQLEKAGVFPADTNDSRKKTAFSGYWKALFSEGVINEETRQSRERAILLVRSTRRSVVNSLPQLQPSQQRRLWKLRMSRHQVHLVGWFYYVDTLATKNSKCTLNLACNEKKVIFLG